MSNTMELREMVKAIDQEIIELIATRMEIVDELAKAKKNSSQAYWDSSVEASVISHYLDLCNEVSLSEDEARKIAEVILHISRERQKIIYG